MRKKKRKRKRKKTKKKTKKKKKKEKKKKGKKKEKAKRDHRVRNTSRVDHQEVGQNVSDSTIYTVPGDSSIQFSNP